MGRIYAGVLGPLACLAVVVRGILHNGTSQSTLGTASICLFAFALMGYVCGTVAGWIVNDSVRMQIAAEAAAAQEEAKAAQAAAVRK